MALDPVSAGVLQDPEAGRILPVEQMGLRELEILRLILRGGSVIDWRHAPFDNHEQVDRFLNLHLLDTRDQTDRALLHRLLKEAVGYLRSTFHYRVADAVAEPFEVQDLFLYASGHHPRHPRRYRKIACIVLKVMHVIHHTEARELLTRTPIASAALHSMVDERVMACLAQMRKHGFPVVEASGSVKTQNSIITKLLAKQHTVAAQVFDKVRYRIVTETKRDILPVLEYLTRTLFPFNLVVSSQTENTLIDFQQVVEQTPELHTFVPRLHLPLRHERERASKKGGNPFSADGYRVLNFVAEVPVRIDNYLPVEGDTRLGRPRVVFAWAEFQMVDRATAEENERGEKSHEAYKRRQREKVLRRLSRGLVVPHKPEGPGGGGQG